MDLTGLALCITALFTGYIAIRQLPSQAKKIDKVEVLVNSKSDIAEARIKSLETEVKRLNLAAVDKADQALAASTAAPTTKESV